MVRSITNQVCSTPSTTAWTGGHPFGAHVSRRGRALDAENADAVGIVEPVLDLLQLGHRLQRDQRAAAIHHDLERPLGAGGDDALHVGEALDLTAVDRNDQVARRETPPPSAALSGRTVSTRAEMICLPNAIATAAKMTIARMKLAIGPAATIAARRATDLWKKLSRASSALIAEMAA